MVSNKQRKKLLKNKKITHSALVATAPYISRMQAYGELFSDYPTVKFLINHVLQSDRLIKQNLLPQDLPELLLPDDIQDQIFQKINQQFAPGDTAGDQKWNQLVAALPQLDADLRGFRDYLEEQYGMWAYISAPLVADIADYVGDSAVLEVMAGNGYISKGLKDLHKTVYTTDSLAWTTENQTGKHQVTDVEKLDAIAAIQKYQDQVDYVIMSWSPDGLPIDQEILATLRQSARPLKLIVLGEKNGATNSKQFWEMAHYIEPEATAKLNRHHQPFDLIKDQIYLID